MAQLEFIKVVMVETTHPGNVGSAARAMKTMGVSELVLVNPKDFEPGVVPKKAYEMATHGKDVLEQAHIVQTLEEAIGDCDLVFGTSARVRKIPWPLLSPRQACEQILSLHGKKIAFVFGREDRGLTNEELMLCNAHVNIPTSDEYSVLNIAMAIQVILYECQSSLGGDHLGGGELEHPLASSSQVEALIAHTMKTMEQVGFYRPELPRQLERRVRRLYTRTHLDQLEVNILRGFLAKIATKVNR